MPDKAVETLGVAGLISWLQRGSTGVAEAGHSSVIANWRQTAVQGSLWPILVYFGLVIIVVGVMIGLPSVLGERHREPHTGRPFESGIEPTGSARMRFDVKYYLLAMFFVVFDLEAAFLFAWAVAAREVGWAGLIEAAVFVVILLAGLVYLWRLGALDWGTLARRGQRLR